MPPHKELESKDPQRGRDGGDERKGEERREEERKGEDDQPSSQCSAALAGRPALI